ncbi:TPA: hypothetical protein ACGWER_002025 [Streptococcus agalactiae]|nr:hypothetical protein [Streptococcus agalactiae]HEO2267343.1 hypothetical protein [Streptococcus agalactiae]
MFDLDVIKKVSNIEKATGKSIIPILKEVPLSTVIVALKEIPIVDLIDMVKSVSLKKLIKGLSIITLKEIKDIRVDKLKVVLKYGNMNTVAELQNRLSERAIIITLNKLSVHELKSLLIEDNLDIIISVINNLGYINNN